VLDLLITEEQSHKFLTALQLTDQQHVINFIRENGGKQTIVLAFELNIC